MSESKSNSKITKKDKKHKKDGCKCPETKNNGNGYLEL